LPSEEAIIPEMLLLYKSKLTRLFKLPNCPLNVVFVKFSASKEYIERSKKDLPSHGQIHADRQSNDYISIRSEIEKKKHR
jgi:hypothetical protein